MVFLVFYTPVIKARFRWARMDTENADKIDQSPAGYWRESEPVIWARGLWMFVGSVNLTDGILKKLILLKLRIKNEYD